MSKKLFKSRKSNQKASNSKENSQISREETPASRRNLVILAAFVLITLSVAGLANWRNLSFSAPANSGPKSASAMVVPSPPTLPSNQPSKEFIYAGNALVATTVRAAGALPLFTFDHDLSRHGISVQEP